MSSPPPKHSLSSPTSGNTPLPVLPTPSSSTSVSIRQNNSSAQLKRELEQQLLEKQRQLKESSSGIGKNVLARQISQLQDRLKEMDTVSNTSTPGSHEELPPVSADRLRSLERDLTSYRSHPLSPGISSIRNKDKLLNQRASNGLDPLPSPSTSTLLPPTLSHDSTSLLPLPPPPTGSTPTKRRSKIPNTDRRNTDIEFATEIGQGLLLEVRKMQALLQEKEEKLRTLENQKADLERAAEAMAKQMRQREENEEKLKEETWNLELAKQELTISVTELQQNLSKANVEQNKLAKQVNELRSEIEQLRDREEKLTNSFDNAKQRHEQDLSSLRRHTAAMQREKTDQMKQIETLTSELAIAKAQSRIGKHVSTEVEPSTRAGETTDDQAVSVSAVKNDTSPTNSPPSSPKQLPARNQAMEVETLKTSLAHAHRMVSNLRSNLHKEKTEKFEFKKLLAESQETIEQLQNDPRMWEDAGPTRGASNSTSNIGYKEDGSIIGRKSHKASSSSKRRGNKKSMTGRTKLRGSSQNTAADGDSVYSYSSMSDQDDSEDMDSFDDSDAGFENVANKKKSVGFTPLSSELSQVQRAKPIMVDAEVNTDPIDNFMLPSPALNQSEQRSLGDELRMSGPTQQKETESISSLKNIAGSLAVGATTALGVDSLLKSSGTEALIQTDAAEEINSIEAADNSIPTKALDLELVNTCSFSIEPKTPASLEFIQNASFGVEPEDPSIALAAATAATAAAILASRTASIEAAVDSSTQSEPEDPSIALATTTAAIAAARLASIEAAVDSSTQSEPEDPSIALAATTAAVAAARLASIEAAVDSCTQSEPEDPSIALAATTAAIAASRSNALSAAIDSYAQCDEIVEDPKESLAAEAAKAAAIAAGIAAGIAELKSVALEKSVDTAVQCEEDPSVANALKEAQENAIASGIGSGIAAGISKSREEALQAAVDSAVQHEEDPSIALAVEASKAAAISTGIAAGIAQLRSAALEKAIDSAVQCEEDPSVANAIKEAQDNAIESGILAGIAKSRAEALQAAVDSSVQYEEDPSIALAAEASMAAAIASGVTAAVASQKAEALKAGIDSSVQYEEDPSVADATEAANAALIAVGIAAGIAKSRSEALEAAVDSSAQHEDDSAQAELALSSAIAASRQASLEAAIDVGVQSVDHESKLPIIAATAAAAATAIAAGKALSSESSEPEVNKYQNGQIDHRTDEVSESDKTLGDADSLKLANLATTSGKQRSVNADSDKDNHTTAAVLPVSSRAISDTEDEFFDATSKPSSRNTIRDFQNATPNANNSLSSNQNAQHSYTNDTNGAKDSQVLRNEDKVKNDHVAEAATAALVAHSLLNNEVTPEQDTETLYSSQPQHIQSGLSKSPVEESNLNADIPPKEKMFTKSETDALIAAAIAAALAGAALSKDHGEEMSNKSKSPESGKTHGSDSAVLFPAAPKFEEDDNNEEDYGNVVVHIPKEEDTITSLPVDQITERQRDRSVAPSTNTLESDYFENMQAPIFSLPVQKERPELTKGPTIVFDQEPGEKEMSEADVPQRPANPPPEELLNRVSLSPAFTNSRSMSPASMRSKGKAPMEHSDFGSFSAHSNEDLQRTAALQQLQNVKRGSIASVSSVSTSNTNEPLQSIHSSQNDASNRNSTITDPNMINLITQTMIGDWMYKYTRKAVGGGISEYRHKRYFWIHPYTRTMYWSTSAPGVDGNEAKAKSALIENITSVPDYSNAGNGGSNLSLLVQTSNRQLKLTAPNIETHELWFEAISHLLARNRNGNGLTLLNDTKKPENTTARSVSSGTGGPLMNRTSFRRLHDIFQQPSSSTSMVTTDDHIDLDDDDEALEDVRMCCNGKHHVSKLEKDHTHRHQYRKRKSHTAVDTVA